MILLQVLFFITLFPFQWTSRIGLKSNMTKFQKSTRSKMSFVTFMGNNFLSQMVSFGICQGVVFSCDKIHCLDPSKQSWALANLWMLASLASQIQNAKLRLCLRSAFGFFNLTSLSEKLGQIVLVIFQGPDNYMFSRLKHQKLINAQSQIRT